MFIKKLLLPFLLFLIFLSSCQQEDASSSGKTSYNGFDPSILKALHAYNLSPSDFEISNAQNLAANKRQGNLVVQKTIQIGDEEIAYFETSGKGPDIFLIHGNTQSSNSFIFQLNSALGQIFHIISIDLPGHGLSKRSPNPAVTYQAPGFADVIVNLVDKLNMKHAVIVGWSLGGNILLEASDRLTDAKGLMLLGASPLANPFDPNAFLPLPTFGLLFKPDLTEAEIQEIVPTFFKPGAQSIPEVFYQDVRIQDPLVRLYLGAAVGLGNYKDQITIVRNLTTPLAVLDGELDQTTNIAYQRGLIMPTLWHNKVLTIPNAGHMAQWENPAYFNVLLAAFVIESNL